MEAGCPRVGVVSVEPSARLGVAASAHYCGGWCYAAAPVPERHTARGVDMWRPPPLPRCCLIMRSTNPREVSLIFRELSPPFLIPLIRPRGPLPPLLRPSTTLLPVRARFPSPRFSAPSALAPPPTPAYRLPFAAALAHPTRSPLPALSLLPRIPYLPSIPSCPATFPCFVPIAPTPSCLPAPLHLSTSPFHPAASPASPARLLRLAPPPVRTPAPFPFPRSPCLPRRPFISSYRPRSPSPFLSPCSLADPLFSPQIEQ
ncbi:hypothetical protein DFH09DRAFT_1415101 [Mycena vulgaris]|nr:hypothetical protein DFH09DRAFT_1415101 [Mycena vulgaris]